MLKLSKADTTEPPKSQGVILSVSVDRKCCRCLDHPPPTSLGATLRHNKQATVLPQRLRRASHLGRSTHVPHRKHTGWSQQNSEGLQAPSYLDSCCISVYKTWCQKVSFNAVGIYNHKQESREKQSEFSPTHRELRSANGSGTAPVSQPNI